MAERLFRDEVIEASRDRLTGTVIAAVPPSSRVYTRLTVVCVMLLIFFLVFGSYTTTAAVRGVVAYDAGVARVYARQSAELAEVHVNVGDRVAKGQPLVTLTIAQGSEGMNPFLAEVATQGSELERQLELAVSQSEAEIAALGHQRNGLVASIASLRRQKAIAEDQQKLAQAALSRAQRLAERSAGTQRQVEDARSELLRRKADLESLTEQIAAQQAALNANDAEQARRTLAAEIAQSEIQARQSQLAEQRARLDRDSRLTLTSPVAGVVGDISLEIGQRVTPDQSVVSVIPGNSQIEVWFYAPTSAVGNARAGQNVRIAFDAFPHEKYGWGQGFVTDVAQVPTEPANIDRSLNLTEPVFRVRTRIEALSSHTEISREALRPGMTVTGRLQLEDRSLWQVFFQPIIEAIGG